MSCINTTYLLRTISENIGRTAVSQSPKQALTVMPLNLAPASSRAMGGALCATASPLHLVLAGTHRHDVFVSPRPIRLSPTIISHRHSLNWFSLLSLSPPSVSCTPQGWLDLPPHLAWTTHTWLDHLIRLDQGLRIEETAGRLSSD